MRSAVHLDTSQLVERLDQISARGLVNALRRTIDKAARQARKETIPIIAKDVNIGASKLRGSLPLVKASTQVNIAASWTIKPSRNNIASTWGAQLPVRGASGLNAKTFVLTGGGSASLNAPKAFVLTLGGNRLVFRRTGKGRAAIKAIFAASTSATMAQANAAPRKAWERRAAELVSANLVVELQKAFDGEVGAATAGTD